MDLFEKEQQIYDAAIAHYNDMRSDVSYSADDYGILAKEYGKLLKQLRSFTRIADKTTGNLNASKLELLDKVHYDALTGIYNRRYFEESLNRILKSASRVGGMLSVLMVDIDFFKKYNDTYGHGRGDECLKSVSNAINDSITRVDDFAARYGGEEFVIVLPYTDEHGACAIANRMLENVKACNIPHEESEVSHQVTISIGATTGTVNHRQTGESYVNKADQALYLSKQNGRNRYTFLAYREPSND